MWRATGPTAEMQDALDEALMDLIKDPPEWWLGFEGRGRPGLVGPSEVVVEEVQADCCGQVLDLLGEGIGSACASPYAWSGFCRST